MSDPGCPVHGWDFVEDCQPCDQADDRAFWREMRWSVLRSDYLPYRVCELLSGRTDNPALAFGPYYWMPPRKGPLGGRAGRTLVRLLNKGRS